MPLLLCIVAISAWMGVGIAGLAAPRNLHFVSRILFPLGAGIGFAKALSRPGPLFFMALSAIGLAVSLFFTSPIESYRYMHWVIISGWAMCWMLGEAMAFRRSARDAFNN